MRQRSSKQTGAGLLSEAEFRREYEARWGSLPDDQMEAKVDSAQGAFMPNGDAGEFNVPNSTANFAAIQALFAAAKAAPAPNKGPLSEKDQSAYVDRAVREGRLGANVVTRVVKGIMPASMAQDYGDRLMADFFCEYRPNTPQERFLVEHLVIVHAQALVVRAKWGGAERLDDIEKLTRIQSRLGAEMLRLLDALAAQREGRRPVITNANIAASQIVHQVFESNELGSKHA